MLLPAQFVDLILQKLGDRAAGVAQTVDRGGRGRVVHGLCLGLDAQTLGGLSGDGAAGVAAAAGRGGTGAGISVSGVPCAKLRISVPRSFSSASVWSSA